MIESMKMTAKKSEDTSTAFSRLDLAKVLIHGEMLIRVRVTGGKVLTRCVTKNFPNKDISVAMKDIEKQVAALFSEAPS